MFVIELIKLFMWHAFSNVTVEKLKTMHTYLMQQFFPLHTAGRVMDTKVLENGTLQNIFAAKSAKFLQMMVELLKLSDGTRLQNSDGTARCTVSEGLK